GPEIRRAADRLEKAIANQPTTAIFFAFEHLKPFEEKLSGHTVKAVETFGKAMVTRFDNEICVYSHNQLYGLWMVRSAHDYPPTKRQLRFAIHTGKKSVLLYSASDIAVLYADEVPHHPFIRNLGPDVLKATTSEATVLEQITSTRFRRKSLSSLLLDQRFLCGIGNYLRSEILFVARTHPTLRPMNCSEAQIEGLVKGAIAIPRQSYQHNGITNDLALAARLKAEGLARREYRHWVFGRETQPCYICGTPIIKAISGGRRYYYCPTCQPIPPHR
ncbi:MAG: endonuclease VIII, partial [Cyanobacteria bacterium Co-bin8]|nr:endonuclease VIII [Cyanobacteria bacterium Co-bin8]